LRLIPGASATEYPLREHPFGKRRTKPPRTGAKP